MEQHQETAAQPGLQAHRLELQAAARPDRTWPATASQQQCRQQQRRRCRGCRGVWVLVAALVALSILPGVRHCQGAPSATVDAAKAAEISRRIREEFRRSGFNWMSPVHFRNMDKLRNIKPFMFLFTTTSCTDCREMLEHLARNESHTFLAGISSQFNSILVLDDFGMEFGSEYAPFSHDYVPRVVFADPDGTVRPDLVNKRGDKTTPYYYNAREMLWAMRNVLEAYHDEMEPFPDDLPDDLLS